MTKRLVGNIIYAFSMFLIVIMRISVSLGLLDGMSEFLADTVWSTVVQIVIMGIVPFLLYSIFLKSRGEFRPAHRIFKDFGYKGGISKKSIPLVLIITILTIFITSCVSSVWYTLIDALGYKMGVTKVEKYTIGTLILDIFISACLPAVFEEFTNRGLLYDANRNTKNPLGVIVLTALMFALMHTNIRQVVYTFVFGLIAGGLVFTTKSIWPAVFLHFTNNLIATLRTYDIRNGGIGWLSDIYNYFEYTLSGNIISAFLFFIFAFILFLLFLKLSDIESTRRMEKGIEPAYISSELEKCGAFDNIPLIFAIVLNGAVTIITFIFGVIR